MTKFLGMFFLLLSLSFAGPAVMTTAAEPAQAASAKAAKVNINVATVKELQTLPGIGKVTAERIVAYRTDNGKFQTPADLRKVKGVGEKSLAKIQNMISVE